MTHRACEWAAPHPLLKVCMPPPSHPPTTCRLLGLMDARIVYVESIARVRKLSLSGHILYHGRVADLVFVQWPELQARYPRSVHAGRLY